MLDFIEIDLDGYLAVVVESARQGRGTTFLRNPPRAPCNINGLYPAPMPQLLKISLSFPADGQNSAAHAGRIAVD
jgi:hypothetical protein